MFVDGKPKQTKIQRENEVIGFVCQETADTGYILLKIQAIRVLKFSDLFFLEVETRVSGDASIAPGLCYLYVHECQL